MITFCGYSRICPYFNYSQHLLTKGWRYVHFVSNRQLLSKNELPLWGGSFFVQRWDSKARPERSEGIKQSGGLFYRAWESPSTFRRIPEGCEWKLNMSDNEKVLVRRTFLKSLDLERFFHII